MTLTERYSLAKHGIHVDDPPSLLEDSRVFLNHPTDKPIREILSRLSDDAIRDTTDILSPFTQLPIFPLSKTTKENLS
jgi:hypothetical protein